MRKWSVFLTIFLFFIWILPLGAFIKPSQEKEACGGKRAICLCSHLLAKQAAKARANWAGKMLILSNHAVDKESSGPGGSSHDYVLSHAAVINHSQLSLLIIRTAGLYDFRFVRLVDHVPKV